MLWIVLARFLVGRTGAATLTCFIQALLVLALGILGSHGAMSLLTYVLPGIMMDLILFVTPGSKQATLFHCFLAGTVANLTGAFGVNLVFFRLPLIPLLISMVAGTLSGGIGGILAYHLLAQLQKSPLLMGREHFPG